MLCIPAFPSQEPRELATLPQSHKDSAGKGNKIISSQSLLTAEEYKEGTTISTYFQVTP
jgi:hypothetical protein